MCPIFTLRSLYITVGVLSVLCIGCKGPIAHNPAPNAPTTKEHSAETLSADLHTKTDRVNYSSLAGRDPNAVERADITSSNQPNFFNVIDNVFPDDISCVSTTAGSEHSAVVQEDGTSPDRPRVVVETIMTSSDDSSHISLVSEIQDGEDTEPDSDPNLSTHTWPLLGDKTQYNTPRRPLQTGLSILNRESLSISQMNTSYFLLERSFNDSRADDRQPD